MTHSTDMTVEQYLASCHGLRVFRVPMVDSAGHDFGNNGDVLIEKGGEKLLAKYGIQTCATADDADVLLFRGNGAMVQGYQVARRLLEHYWQSYPDTPITMLPATFYYPDTAFTQGLGPRAASVLLFCRERFSYRHLTVDHQLPDFCRVGLGRDTAFELHNDPIVTDYQDLPPRHVLICERCDREHPTNQPAFWQRPSAPLHRSPLTNLSRRIPQQWKKPLYSIRAALQGRQRTPFRELCESIIQRQCSQHAKLPRYCRDVSDPRLGDFDYFRRRIAESAVVFSTRLHVAIYAAMLGKPTYLFEGPYHKIRAIYEYCLRDLPHVTFVRRDELAEVCKSCGGTRD